MTPAEELAQSKRRKRPRRNQAAPVPDRPFHCRIREMREALDLSMQDVAKATGLSTSSFFKIEHGCDIHLSNALCLAKFFGTTVDQLWIPRNGQAD